MIDGPLEQVPFRFNLESPDGRLWRRQDAPSSPRLFPATERDFKQDKAVVEHVYNTKYRHKYIPNKQTRFHSL